MFVTKALKRGALALIAAALAAPSALAGEPIEVIDVALQIGPIGGPTPVPIPCGGSVPVLISITVYVDPGQDLPPVSEQNNWAKIYEDDDLWNDGADFLDEKVKVVGNGWKVRPGDVLANNTAIINLTTSLSCSAKTNGVCELNGIDDDDDAGGVLDIYVEAGHLWGARYSNTVQVQCVNSNGNATVSASGADAGGSASCEGTLDTDGDVAHVDWGVTYDPAAVVVTNAMFEPGAESLFAATQVDLSVPGMVRFTADSPVNLPAGSLEGPLWLMELEVLPGTPYGQYPITTTSDSAFSDELFMPLGINRGAGMLLVAQDDATPPVIDAGLVTVDPAGDQVIGAPGAVLDDYLGLPDFGEVRLFLGHDPPGGDVPPLSVATTTVADDGSFLIEGFVLHAAIEDLVLTAYDGRGNAASSPLEVPCVWSEGFGAYEPGSAAHNQGDWRGWDNDPAATASISDAQSRSTGRSIEVSGPADQMHRHCTDGVGEWTYTAWQYIPADFASESNGDFAGTYFILLNTYDHGGPYHWSVQMQFDSNDGLLKVFHGEDLDTVDVPYETDRWVRIQVQVDLDEDWTRVYYDDQPVAEYSWTGGVLGDGGGVLDVAAVDLYAHGSSPVYYDDLGLEPLVAEPCETDLDGDGSTGTADLLALLAAWGPNPGHPADLDGDAAVGTADLLALLSAWGDC